jgi:hypothetical protein
MLEDRPILKDRLLALATFSGIAIAAVSGFELVITGGFDFMTPGAEVRQVAPSAYVQVIDVPWSNEGRVVTLSSNEYMFAGEAAAATMDDLAGSVADETAPDGGYPVGPTADEISASIETLYETSGAAEYQPAEEESWGDGYYADDGDLSVKDDASAYGSGSPS